MGHVVPKKAGKWRKILYERQPFPDNYGGGSEFLKELRTNVAVVKYTWLEAACGASRVFLHENAIVAYLITFENLKKLPVTSSYTTLYDHVCTLLVLLLFGYALTPVISTLTTTISTDTIYAMSIVLFLSSFIFHDYGMDAAMVSVAFSVNLSLAASVCLVSRIELCDIAFCLLAFSIALFSYWPKFRNCFCHRYPLASFLMASIFSPIILFYLHKISPPLGVLHLLLHFLIVFVAPWILIKMQRLKSTIHGPWDEVSPFKTILAPKDLNRKIL